MIEYEWDISSLKVLNEYKTLENCVFQVFYCLNGTDTITSKVASICGDLVFDIQNLDTTNFVSFDSLTKDTVVGWMESTFGEEQILQFKQDIERRLNREERIVLPPWVTEKTSETEQEIKDSETQEIEGET
jgi:hypothetical protein